MAGSNNSEGQAVWQPGGAEEDSCLREGNRRLHLAYDEEETPLGYLSQTEPYQGAKGQHVVVKCLGMGESVVVDLISELQEEGRSLHLTFDNLFTASGKKNPKQTNK